MVSLLPRALASAKSTSTNACSVFVFPVPGGPCNHNTMFTMLT